MGSSLSRLCKRKTSKFDVDYTPPSFPPRPVQTTPITPLWQRLVEEDAPKRLETIPVYPPRQIVVEENISENEYTKQHVSHNGIYGNDEYYDDEDMMRFVSALSLAEFNQNQHTLKPKAKQPSRLPDALEEFFLSLDAQASAGPSTWEQSTSVEQGRASQVPPYQQECSICIEKKPLKDFPKITDSCQHPDQTCLICVRDWLAREVDSTDWDKIHCVACKEVVPYDDMKRLMTSSAFEKYDQYSRNSTLSKIPNFRWCISPTCKSGQIHEDGTDGPIFFCQACDSKACVIHNVPWHEGETCAEYDYRKDPQLKVAEERASVKEIKGSSKKCPGKRCNVRITRNGGCDHMKCTRCNYEFCWLCLADYDKIRKQGNSAHEKTCKLHSDNLPSLLLEDEE